MSRRFGRNQRRRAREAQAALQAENDKLLVEIDSLREAMFIDHQLLRDQGHKLFEAEAFTRRVAGLVGARSVIAGKPPRVRIQMPLQDAVDFGFLLDPLPLAFHALSNGQHEFESISTIRAQLLRALNVKAIAEHFSRLVHVEAELAGQKVRYSLSDEMLYDLTARELAEQIGPPMIEMLAEVVKGMKR